MGGCTAVNCTNSRRKGIRLFRFPKDETRRKIWLQNCRRDKWVPTNSSGLCEIHFEESQFEQHRQGGIKKLKSNAIPTLFNVPNPPRLLETKRKSLYKTVTECSSQGCSENSSDSFQNEKNLSQLVTVLENNDVSTNNGNFKPNDSDFVNGSTLLKERQKLFLTQQENTILKMRLQLGVNEASNTFYSKLLEGNKYHLLLLQREKKLLETKLQIFCETLDDITSPGSG
eukprot:XP_016656055.1 PREDICTED: THAP domain-containing protein 2-like [Acyrthosiphon pisum]